MPYNTGELSYAVASSCWRMARCSCGARGLARRQTTTVWCDAVSLNVVAEPTSVASIAKGKVGTRYALSLISGGDPEVIDRLARRVKLVKVVAVKRRIGAQGEGDLDCEVCHL